MMLTIIVRRVLMVCCFAVAIPVAGSHHLALAGAVPDLAHGWQQVKISPGQWASVEGAGQVVSNHGVLLATGRGLYEVGVIDPLLWRSTDGTTWQELTGVAFQIDRVLPWRQGFVAVGRTLACIDYYPGGNGPCATEANEFPPVHGISALSADGLSWRFSPTKTARHVDALLDVAANRRVLLAISGTGIWRSHDGLTWQEEVMPRSVFPLDSHVENITRWRSGFVVTGRTSNGAATIWFSVNGTRWERVWEDTGAATSKEEITGVMSDAGHLIAWGPSDITAPVGYNTFPGTTIWTSTDGKTWQVSEPSAFQASAISQIVTSSVGYLAVGSPAGLWISQDTITWTRATPDGTFVGYPYADASGQTLPADATTSSITVTPQGLVVVGEGTSRNPGGPFAIATAWLWPFPPSTLSVRPMYERGRVAGLRESRLTRRVLHKPALVSPRLLCP